MSIEVSIAYQAEIKFENNQITAVGSKQLLEKVNSLAKKFGIDPQKWPLQKPVESGDDILINELIEKANARPFIYNHEELCHCRMVKTELVRQVIKQGCRSIAEVSRTTMAGTGCGSCRKDIDDVLDALTT
jgi:bacterioferritin-associated ferredoxin